MIIKILGPGCNNCTTLEQRTKEAINELNIEADIEKVTDYQEIASYGVMKTPALVLDGKLLFYGRVPTVSSLKEYFTEDN